MARVRLSAPAQADIAAILKTSETPQGADARVRYRALLSPAPRRIAADPHCVSSAARDELLAGLRSFHIRYSRDDSREPPVVHAVHVIFYRAVEPGLIEVLRVLHERMEPSRHVG
ncbi:MAG: type II toxin-antitoxin system RelE/ParE family toxin [Pseudorhodoplanes sp.]